MKKIIYFALFLIMPNIYCQEEFFGDNNGLSSIYFRGYDDVNSSVDGGGFCYYLKKDIAFGVTAQVRDKVVIPTFFMEHFFDRNFSFIKPVAGLSYSLDFKENHIIGFSAGLSTVFLLNSNFPFLLNASSSINIGLVTNNDYYYNDVIYNIMPIMGFGYTQAFFAKNKVYPYIGVSYSFEVMADERNDLYSIMVGLNVKFGKKK